MHGMAKQFLEILKEQIEYANIVDLPKFYYLDLLNHREISNEIAQKFSGGSSESTNCSHRKRSSLFIMLHMIILI